MNIDKQLTDDHQAKLTVEVDNDTLESNKRRAARQLAKRVKIPGFRPGKAPYNVIVKHIGEGAIIEDAINLIIEDIYPKVIEETELTPYGPGSLDEIASMEPPTFSFSVPLAPEVELGDYRELRLDYEAKEVSDEDINKVLDNMREEQAVIEPVERPAEEGDMVYIVLNGQRKDEEDESKKTIVKERRYPVVIEKEETDDVDEWPFPGFSRNLLGLSADEEKTVEYTFSEDYAYEDMQSVAASYTIKVEDVKGRSLPDLDDEFAKSVSEGEHETLEALKENITETLSERYEQETNAEYESKTLDMLVEQAEIKYPPQMLDHEIDHALEDLEQQLSYSGMNMENYLSSRDMEMDALREELSGDAIARIQRGLVLMEIANKEDIKLKQEEVEQRTAEAVQQIQMMLPEDQARQVLTNEAIQGLASRIISDEINGRTLERIRKIAKGEPIEEETEEEETADEDETSETEMNVEDTAEDSAETAEMEEAEADSEEEVKDEIEEESELEEEEVEAETDESESDN